MYSIGDIVLHLASGVCQIDDIREEAFTGQTKLYYVMHAMDASRKGTIFVPVEPMKPVLRDLLNEDEIQENIANSVKEQVEWIDNNNVRKTKYNEILKSDNLSKIIALVTCLHKRKEHQEEIGKKFPVIDERIMGEAEKRIQQEVSFALHMDEAEVKDYIFAQLAMV